MPVEIRARHRSRFFRSELMWQAPVRLVERAPALSPLRIDPVWAPLMQSTCKDAACSVHVALVPGSCHHAAHVHVFLKPTVARPAPQKIRPRWPDKLLKHLSVCTSMVHAQIGCSRAFVRWRRGQRPQIHGRVAFEESLFWDGPDGRKVRESKTKKKCARRGELPRAFQCRHLLPRAA